MHLWEMIETVITYSPRVMLFGPPGTGKTHAATRYGIKGRHVYGLTLTEETPMAELRGHFIPKGGEFIWMDGPVTRAMRQGARLVLNEIDLASGDVSTFLYSVADDPELASITLPTGELITPETGFQIISTMNGKPDDLAQALKDRFPAAIEVTEPHPDAIKRLPGELQNLAKEGVHSESARQASVRSLMAFEDLRKHMPEEEAARAIFGVRAKDVVAGLKLQRAQEPRNGKVTA